MRKKFSDLTLEMNLLRPLGVFAIAIVLILAFRSFFAVPKDFGVGERGYMYGWHRAGNEGEWNGLKAKYQGREYCKDCHADEYAKNQSSPHVRIQCENCHGPALDHPDTIEKLPINKAREVCLRCHAKLNYPSSDRGKLKGIDNLTHNPGSECVSCHNPHHPNLEAM
jgi:hypothetical protein